MGSYISLSRISAVFAMVLAWCMMFPSGVIAKIPLYAQDYGTVLAEYPETINLVNLYGTVYNENFTNEGDALSHFPQSNMKAIQYLSMSTMYYGGFAGYVTSWDDVWLDERNFYHSTDPSSLVAWRSSGGDSIQVRWGWDLRTVPNDVFELDSGDTSIIKEYKLIKINLTEPDTTEFTVLGTNSFIDSPVDASAEYSYRVVSRIDQEYWDFTPSDSPFVVSSDISPGPHFWDDRKFLQEGFYYAEWDTVNDWCLRFGVDQNPATAGLFLEVWGAYDPGSSNDQPLLTLTNYSYDPGAGTVEFELPWGRWHFTEFGGLAYRLGYHDGSQIQYFPRERSNRCEFLWSSRNNRTMGCSWECYMMNLTKGDTWLTNYIQMAQEICQDYEGLFVDNALWKLADSHNVNRPIEYNGAAGWTASTISFIESVSDSVAGDLYLNTLSTQLMEAVRDEVNVKGMMYENGTATEDNYLNTLLRLGWLINNPENSDLQTLVQNAFDFNFISYDGGGALSETGDMVRIQALGTYLFSKKFQDSENSVFGFGKWFEKECVGGETTDCDSNNAENFPGQVNILPEQLLDVRNPYSEDWLPGQWPSASDVETVHCVNGGSGAAALDWMVQNYEGIASLDSDPTRKFLFRDLELFTGDASHLDTVRVVLDGGNVTPITVSLGNIFGADKVYHPWYRLRLENNIALVTEGAFVYTDTFGVNDTWTTAMDSVAIFINKPISSPHVSAKAKYSLPLGVPEPELVIEASHWNGAELDTFRVDATVLGWNSILLTDNDLDGDYSWVGSQLSGSPGTVFLPYVAVGNDGLRRYGEVEVQIAEAPSIEFENKSDLTGDLYDGPQAGNMPYASVAFDYDSDNRKDLFVTYVDTTGLLFWNQAEESGVPDFADHTRSDIDFNNLPGENQKGIAFAEVAFLDTISPGLFVANPHSPDALNDPQILVWDFGSSKLVDLAGSLLSFMPQGAYDGAWADYDGDGHMDLAVACSPMPEDGAKGSASSWGALTLLYHHIFDEETGIHSLEPVWGDSIFPIERHFSYEVDWCDAGGPTGEMGQELPDLFICDLLGTNSCALLINQGPDAEDVYSFKNATDVWFPAGSVPRGVRSAVFANFNKGNDNWDHLDDLAICSWGQEDNLVIYLNTGSGFSLADKSSRFVPREPRDLNGLAIEDFDNNGSDDLLIQPFYNEEPYFLLNNLTGVAGNFSRFNKLSLGQGRINGVAVADWGDDGDPDLYLGRKSAEEAFFFQNNVIAGEGAAPYVKIKLSGGGGENLAGVGAAVEVLTPSYESFQRLRGKNGRNGQPLELIFPLPGFAGSSVDIKVTWPSGHVQEQSCPVNTLTTIQDDSYQIVPGSVISNYRPSPTGTDWVFEWVTKGPPLRSEDYVLLRGATDVADPCYCGGVQMLTADLGMTELTITPEAGGWRHVMVWHNGCCIVQRPACVFTFDVGSGNTLGADASLNHTFKTMKVCGFGF